MKIEFRNVNPQEFPYLHQVIHECLRVNHPVPTSDEYKILKDCQLGGFNFKKDQSVMFDYNGIHNNPNEWQQPDKFLPDRHDPNHELFKTPSGDKRHPKSFVPFSFGERHCLGYQLAKFTIPNIWIQLLPLFDLEFVDKE